MTRELAAQILAEGGTTRMTTKPKPKPEPDAERRFREGREAVAAQEHGWFEQVKEEQMSYQSEPVLFFGGPHEP